MFFQEQIRLKQKYILIIPRHVYIIYFIKDLTKFLLYLISILAVLDRWVQIEAEVPSDSLNYEIIFEGTSSSTINGLCI